ncbi:hypothetical protein BGZ83_004284 [Gryganskiella cystojenkinii]|nr:hypothetical protein BGZ83_004284 [Gryganskiella cystojenkinii]
MSQNSPNGDPASSPSLSASSPTSTTSKKRTRASVEQLAILEDTFLTNQSPNSKVREILAKKVKMSERSIQIWFQNRRAKVKQAQKRTELVQQEAMKAQYLNNCAAAGVAPQPIYGFGPAGGIAGGKGFPMGGHLHPSALARAPLSRATSYDSARAGAIPGRFAQTGLGINVNGAQAAWGAQPGYPMQAQGHPGFGFRPNMPPAVAAARGMKRSFDGVNGPLSAGAIPKPLHFPGTIGVDGLPSGSSSPDLMFGAGMVPTGSSQIPTLPTFNCDNLAIGTWRRMSTSNTDLSCFYCPTTRIMTWQIIDHAARFKMTFPLSSISRIEFYEVDPMYSQVDFDLLETPQFFMETVAEDQTREWKKCSDFTEAKQATLVMRHTIHGMSSALKMQVMSLTIAYPPLQAITSYREPQFPTQFHAYTAPIPQIAQFLDPTQYDRRYPAGTMGAAPYMTLSDGGLDSGGEGSDLGEDFYDQGFGTHFTSTSSALLDLGTDGTQPPRMKSRRTASMPTPAMHNFLSPGGLNATPYHSSPLSMYSTTGANLEVSGASSATLAAVAAAATAASDNSTTTPNTAGATVSDNLLTVSSSSPATLSTTTTTTSASTPAAATISSSAPVVSAAPVVTTISEASAASTSSNTLAPSTIATATTMPKVTITTLSDSQGNTEGATQESTTVLHDGETATTTEKGKTATEGNQDGDRSSDPVTTAADSNQNPMGLTSQFNEFLAQAVVSTAAMVSPPFTSTGYSQGMMYGGGMPTQMMHHNPQAFQLDMNGGGGGLVDGNGGYEFTTGYYGMIPEQASFVSMSDLEGSTGHQTDGEESSYGAY